MRHSSRVVRIWAGWYALCCAALGCVFLTDGYQLVSGATTGVGVTMLVAAGVLTAAAIVPHPRLINAAAMVAAFGFLWRAWDLGIVIGGVQPASWASRTVGLAVYLTLAFSSILAATLVLDSPRWERHRGGD